MDEAVQLIRDLVRFPTTEGNPAAIRSCAAYISSCLKRKGIIVREHERNGKISVVALFEDTKSPDIFLNAHFDVVPASSPLFEPRQEGGKLYGRGSEDCKAQVALLILLMQHFSKGKEKPSIGIMLTSDEEVHGADGVRFLIEDLGYRCKFAVVADGGDNFDIVTKHKGVLQVRVSAAGKTAHSSRYWEGGENAIEKLMGAYSKIKKMFPVLSGPEWKTTATLSKIAGGKALNQVPDYAELYLDIRLTENDSEDSVMKQLSSVGGISVEKVASCGMLNTDVNNKYISLLQKSAELVLKRKVRTYYEHGATDARYFSEAGIPAILFKPIGFGAHSETEHVLISSLEPYFNIMLDFISHAARKLT